MVSNLIALFDNEEIGNTSKQGAASILLHDMVKRIYRSLGCSEEETDCAMYGGMLLSVDVAHALHPNHKEKMDITNHPVLGDGFCIKEACSQSYATDAKAIGIRAQRLRSEIKSHTRGLSIVPMCVGVVHWDRLHPRCFRFAQWILEFRSYRCILHGN